MFKKLYGVVFLLTLWNNPCEAQSSNGSQEAAIWGVSSCDVYLSISISNNIIHLGSPTSIHCSIKNSSTNVVAVSDTGIPIYDSDVSMIDGSGKNFDLTPADKLFRAVYMNIAVKINPKQTYVWDIPLNYGKNIEPGSFKLKVSRQFYIQDRKYNVTSNLLVVQVK